MKVLISKLNPYPWNKEVYGTDSTEDQKNEMEELVNDIAQNGVLTPPVVDQDFYVISGNRRLRACTILGMKEIEVDRFEFSDEMQRIMYLFSSNKYRTKTVEMKAREAIFLKTAYKKYADSKRREETDPDYVFDDDAFRNLVGKDAISQCVGMPERTLRKAINVVEKIDSLEEIGKKEEAAALRESLESNISGAEKAAKGKPSNIVDFKPDDYDEDSFWYWKELKSLIIKMKTSANKLRSSPRHNHTTATALIWLLDGIFKTIERLESWDPERLEECEHCEGKGRLPGGSKCPVCIDGEIGYYVKPAIAAKENAFENSKGANGSSEPGDSEGVDEHVGKGRNEKGH